MFGAKVFRLRRQAGSLPRLRLWEREKMKKVYKYIKFTEYKKQGIAYELRNKKSNEVMGDVYYYSQWRQFVIDFREDCVFNNQCLLDIADFLEQLNKGKPDKK